MCVHCVSMHSSRFVLVITTTFMHGFSQNKAQLVFLRSSSAVWISCSGRLKTKVTHEGQRKKWSYTELIQTIISILMHGFLHYVLEFCLRYSSAIWNNCLGRLKVNIKNWIVWFINFRKICCLSMMLSILLMPKAHSSKGRACQVVHGQPFQFDVSNCIADISRTW